LSGPTIVFGAVVVVPLGSSCGATVVCVAGAVAVMLLCVCPELVAFGVGAALVAVLPFFFALAVGVVCAVASDPVIRKALIQKLAANFKYFFIGVLSKTCFVCRNYWCGFTSLTGVGFSCVLFASRFPVCAPFVAAVRSSYVTPARCFFASAELAGCSVEAFTAALEACPDWSWCAGVIKFACPFGAATTAVAADGFFVSVDCAACAGTTELISVNAPAANPVLKYTRTLMVALPVFISLE
jgi:hypothetical protein